MVFIFVIMLFVVKYVFIVLWGVFYD